jgi:hypothetical protein
MFGEKNIIMNVLNVQFLSSSSGPDTTRIEPETEGHYLVTDNLMYFDSNCHAFGERHCLQLQSRSYPLV